MPALIIPKIDANSTQYKVVEFCVPNMSNVVAGDSVLRIESSKTVLDVETHFGGKIFFHPGMIKFQLVPPGVIFAWVKDTTDEAPDFAPLPRIEIGNPSDFRLSKKAAEYAERNSVDLAGLPLTGLVTTEDLIRALEDRGSRSQC